MSLRKRLNEEMDLLIGLIPQYRVEAIRAAIIFENSNDMAGFQTLMDAQWAVRSAEDRLDFVMMLLDSDDE